jgi:hypothetical protein
MSTAGSLIYGNEPSYAAAVAKKYWARSDGKRMIW